MHGHTPVVQVLLEEGADLVSCNWGAQALNVAAQNGYSEIVQCLLDKGVNVDAVDPSKSDYTPLLWAASRGHTDAVKVLLDSGARTHLIDDLENDPKSCCSALVYAATNGHAAVVQLILDIAPNCQTRARWLEVVFDLTTGSWKFKMGMAHVLMKKGGCHIDEVIDRGGTTALHVAVDSNNLALVTQLLDKGANIEKPDVFKMTALHKAVRGGHAEMVQLLLERDANIGATAMNGSTALHMAINHPPPQISAFDANQGERSSRIVELLLSHGADVFKEDNDGKTPLDHLPSSDPRFNSLVSALLLAEMERFVMVPRPREFSSPPPAYEEA
ncbi:ankyrin repeat-containing domain protein [Terfezia claveryi]|nr:ankyrin repeat-containing domain protein [Terfezia claveryi]